MNSKIKALVSIILSLIIFNSCKTSNKLANSEGKYEYELCVFEKGDSARIISNKTIGVSDTIIAFVSGQVFAKEELLFTLIISFSNKKLNRDFIAVTNDEGKYKISIPSGLYDIRFQCVGYEDFVIKNLTFGTGQIQEIKIDFGNSGGFTTYVIVSNKRLSRKNLGKRLELHRKLEKK